MGRIHEYVRISSCDQVSNQLSLNPKGDYPVGPDLNMWILKRAQPFRKSETHAPAGLDANIHVRNCLWRPHGKKLWLTSRSWECSPANSYQENWQPWSYIWNSANNLNGPWKSPPRPHTRTAMFSAVMCPDFWLMRPWNNKWVLFFFLFSYTKGPLLLFL